MAERWQAEYVIALAPDAASAGAARRLALAAQWADTGCDDRAVWGRYRGPNAEPYEVAVELEDAACRCTCLSRKLPCKHALGLLLLWSRQVVVDDVARPAHVARWLRRRRPAAVAPVPAASPAPMPSVAEPSGAEPSRAEPAAASGATATAARAGTAVAGGDVAGGVDPAHAGPADDDPLVMPPPERHPDLTRRAAERAARVAAGLAELDRWLADQVRTGLAAAGLHRPEPWEAMAARLVDAQAGSLANRLRRLGARLATAPDHHEALLAEMGVLHLLACGGRRSNHLPGPLAEAVRSAVGWTVRRDDVLALPPVTDRWLVAGRSDVQEDRIVVRRTWLCGVQSGRWGMVLSFAAYGQSLESGLPVGTTLLADLHFYPSAWPLRAIVGCIHDGPHRPGDGAGSAGAELATVDLAAACDGVGAALAAEPWLERWPVAVGAAPAWWAGGWVLADATGSLPVAREALGAPGLMDLVALSAGRPLAIVAEWTADGLVPLAAHLDGRVVDVGPHGPWGYG